MRNFKKLLSLVLCMAVMLSVMVVGAGAAFKDQEKIKNTEAVDVCSALNIINGYEDGSFKPEGNITRAEACKMICVALNGGKEPALGTTAKSSFTDTKGHWAEGYIESCVAQGIVAGVGGGKFDPSGNVTGTQFAKMLLIALGYKADIEGYVGAAWEVEVNVDASAKGLYADLSGMDPSKALSRDNAAQMVWNALQAYEVEYKSVLTTVDGQLTSQLVCQDKVVGSNSDKIKLIEDKYEAWINVGTLTAVKGKQITITMNANDKTESDLVIKDQDYVDFTKLDVDYSNLLGQKVKVIFKNGKTNDVMGVYATKDNTVYETIVNKVDKDGDKVEIDGTSYSVETAGIQVYVDGAPVVDRDGKLVKTQLSQFDDAAKIDASLASNNNQSADVIKFVDSNDNDKIDTALISTVKLAKVTYTSSKELIAGNTSYKYEDENIAQDIVKNDYVVITENLYGECKDIVKATKISGDVTGYKDTDSSGTVTAGDKYLIDGTWYVVGVDANMNSIQVGNKVDAWVYNGVVAYAKRTSGEAGTIDNVCVITAIGSNIEGQKVKIATFDGKETIVAYDDEDHSGDGYVAPSALRRGVAYEYEIVKDEYRFKALNTTTDWYGDYTALNVSSNNYIKDSNNATSGTVDTVAAASGAKGIAVADNAKIILVTDTNVTSDISTKVITGKQLKSMGISTDGTSDTKATTDGTVAAFTSKVDGLTKVTYAVIEVNGVSSTFSTNDSYGYITDSAYKSATGYITYKVWTGTEEVTVTEKASTPANRAKGTVIGYSSIKDGVIEDVTTDIATHEDAIIGVNDDQTKVVFNSQNNTQYKITSDTVVLYVDTVNYKGLAGGSIVEADKFGDSYFNNVIVKTVGTDEVELLVVDVKNKLNGEITMDSPAAADINAALVSGDVTVTGTLPAGVKIPAGKTLTVVEVQAPATLEAIAGPATGSANLVLKAAGSSAATTEGKFKDKNDTDYGTAGAAAVKADTYTWQATYWKGTNATK